jgi:alpha-tubulin suppressor-like RCC1 family protein
MDFFPQPPPQPMDSDRINAAFDHLGEVDGMNDDYGNDAYGNGTYGAGAYDDDDYQEEDYYADYRNAPVVNDYATELPEEESEGWAYNAEKRQIRETVDLGDAHLFIWGDGTHGKLGHNSEDSLHVPFLVSSTTKIPIRMCALGKDHTVLLAVEGYALTCGSNAYGQLGTGDQEDMRMTLTLVQGANDLRAVATGHYHTVAMTGSGKVLSWGGGSWGKLGLSSDANVKTPRSIASLQNSIVEYIACGAHHTTAITNTGDVWTWGKGLRGQLGHNSVKEEFSPRICALLRKAGAERIRSVCMV